LDLHSSKILLQEIDKRKSPSPNNHHPFHHLLPHKSEFMNRRQVKSPEHSDDEHFTSDEHHHSSSNENSPILSRNTSNGNITKTPKIIPAHRKYHRKKEHKTPPDVEVHSQEHSPRDHELTSEEENKNERIIVYQKKSKPRKNLFTLSHEEVSRDESEDGSFDHDTTSDLSTDSHSKKHHFHFPSFHSLWNHKKPSFKKEHEKIDHSTTSEHDNDTERTTSGPTSSRRLRDSDSHKRHNHLAHRLVGPLIEMESPVDPSVNTNKN
jgi:hypothetical protein